MSAGYAYLVVEHHRYEIPRDPPASTSRQESPPGPDPDAPFAQRVRHALEIAAQNAAYGSVQALLGSRRSQASPAISRANHVRTLVNAGLLERDAEVDQMLAGVVPEPVWKILSKLTADAGSSQPIPDATSSRSAPQTPGPPPPRVVMSWVLTLQQAEDARDFKIDPEKWPAIALPAQEIVRALNELAGEGWRVIEVSEDRSINDDASTSFIVGQRYLLVRDGA